MLYYHTIVTLHIIFAGVWLTNFFIGSNLKRSILNEKGTPAARKYISSYLNLTNLIGMIGAIGILITGIIMVFMNPGYSFFQMSGNHWLTTKQIVMVVILLLIFGMIIPNAKKLRANIKSDMEKSDILSESTYSNLTKLFKVGFWIDALVIVNFLFAITNRLFG
jgi:uncharacterized membrane protein